MSHLIVKSESRFPAGNFFIAHGIGAKTVKKLCVGSILSAPETSARNRPILNMPLLRSPVLNSEFLVSISCFVLLLTPLATCVFAAGLGFAVAPCEPPLLVAPCAPCGLSRAAILSNTS